MNVDPGLFRTASRVAETILDRPGLDRAARRTEQLTQRTYDRRTQYRMPVLGPEMVGAAVAPPSSDGL